MLSLLRLLGQLNLYSEKRNCGTGRKSKEERGKDNGVTWGSPRD
jgi:hypothetical protein